MSVVDTINNRTVSSQGFSSARYNLDNHCSIHVFCYRHKKNLETWQETPKPKEHNFLLSAWIVLLTIVTHLPHISTIWSWIKWNMNTWLHINDSMEAAKTNKQTNKLMIAKKLHNSMDTIFYWRLQHTLSTHTDINLSISTTIMQPEKNYRFSASPLFNSF